MKTKIVFIAIVIAATLLGIPMLTDTRPIKATEGCITVSVQYKDGCPRPGADVFVYSPISTFLGTTDSNGKVQKCEFLSPGEYWIKAIYAGAQFGPNTYLYVDANGDGSATIIGFENETIPPVIEILSPENTTYATISVPLNFTYDDFSPIDWIGYSLDGAANVTITGNTTLTGLTQGPHNIVVYANDTYGNMGSSDKVYFTCLWRKLECSRTLLVLH